MGTTSITGAASFKSLEFTDEVLKKKLKKIKKQAKSDLLYLTKYAKKLKIHNVCKVVLEDPKFFEWSASTSPKVHHYGIHGLIIHTTDVIRNCMAIRNLHPEYEIDEKEVFLAGLFHDYGKIWDYTKVNVFSYNRGEHDFLRQGRWKDAEHKRLIHHVSKSTILFNEVVKGTSCEKYTDAVTHAILAHHGRQEWGSPVRPRSRVAWLLHLSDSLSSRLNDADTLDRTD
jgi:3'-5' exoribonuclease